MIFEVSFFHKFALSNLQFPIFNSALCGLSSDTVLNQRGRQRGLYETVTAIFMMNDRRLLPPSLVLLPSSHIPRLSISPRRGHFSSS